MKKINFVPQRQKQWSKKTSLVFVLSILCAVVFLQVRQWKTLNMISHEKENKAEFVANITNLSEKKTKLLEKKKELDNRLTKLQRFQESPHHYFSLFNKINKMLKGTGQLNTLNLFQNKINLAVQCPDIKQATHFMHHLLELPSVADLKLVSILPKENQFLFEMDGTLS